MADCFFFPTDPKCAPAVPDKNPVQPPPSTSGGDNEWFWGGRYPFLGQIAFTLIAFSGAGIAGLNLFRYQRSVTYFDNGKLIGSINWWMLSSRIMDWGSLVIFGFFSFTQLLSNVGLATNLNLNTWGFLSILAVLADLTAYVMLYWAYDRTWDCGQDSANKNQAQCSSTAVDLYNQLVRWVVKDTAIWLIAYTYLYDWVAAQWMGLSDEKKKIYKGRLDKWQADIDDSRNNMLALFQI